MEKEENKTKNLQEKSHEVLLKLLNNIGIVGAILAAIIDIIFVIIFVIGIEIKVNMKSSIMFAIVNALIGIVISCLLRYQGQKYAEIEKKDLVERFYKKEIKEKKHIKLSVYNFLSILKDVIIKGGTTVFSIFGMIYISIEGSKNPIQILITLATLIMFACFGLISMNSSYCRYYNIEVPYMENELKKEKEQKREVKKDGVIQRW